METESVVQPGAPIPQSVQIPSPLEGNIVLEARPSAIGMLSTIYKGKWTLGGHESLVCVKLFRMTLGEKAVPGPSIGERLQSVSPAHFRIVIIQSLMNEHFLVQIIQREILIWGNASHPNIYPYLGYQVGNRETWLVSPWSENGSLLNYLPKHRDIGYKERLKLGSAVFTMS